MLGLNDGLFIKPKLSSFRVLVFQHTVILLLLAGSCRGQSQVAQPSQTIVTLIGEDVVLPCRLEPPLDAVSKSVEWGRPDLEPRFVHVWHEGQNHLVNQNPSYKGRTSVSIDNLKQGDLSLHLSAVNLSDNGVYRCYFPSQDKKSNVELVVGSVASPVIAWVNINSSRVVLQCNSTGWYPEPEVFWLDAEGNLLSAGPTETVRGPDDLYTVSSRVTVEKRHSNNFTCRVQQNYINQTRETLIHVPEDVFMEPSSSAVGLHIILSVVCVLLCSALVFAVWKLRRNKSQNKKHHDKGTEEGTEETELLVNGQKKMEHLDDEKLKEKVEEKMDIRDFSVDRKEERT